MRTITGIQPILIMAVLIMGSCESNDQSSTEINLTAEQSFKVEEEAAPYLSEIHPVAAASGQKERIAISHTKNPVGIITIDYRGNLKKRFGSQGRGPEEIQLVRHFGFDRHDNLAAYDRSLAAIKLFDPRKNIVVSHEPEVDGLSITSSAMSQCPDENEWMLGINPYQARADEDRALAGVYDSTFALKNTFGRMDPYFDGETSIMQEPIISLDCENDQLFTTHFQFPFIQVFEPGADSATKRIDEVPPSFKLSDEFIDRVQNVSTYQEYLIEDQSVTSFLTHTDRYLLLIFRNETQAFYDTRDVTEREHYLAVYSRKDYSLIGEVPVDGAPLGFTKEGYIITLKNSDPYNFQIELLDVGVIG